MATNPSLVDYVCEQLQGAGEVRYRKMFGEYGIYLNDVYFALYSNDRFFVKISEEGKKYLKEYKTGSPYKGAKEAFLITDLDNRKMLQELALITIKNLPAPKSKKRINKKHCSSSVF